MESKLIITKKHPRGADGYKVFSVRIKEELVNRIEEMSNETARSRNELIGMLLEYALDNCVVKGNGKN